MEIITGIPSVSLAKPDEPSYYMKLINIRDVEVSISAWVSHAMPFKARIYL